MAGHEGPFNLMSDPQEGLLHLRPASFKGRAIHRHRLLFFM